MLLSLASSLSYDGTRTAGVRAAGLGDAAGQGVAAVDADVACVGEEKGRQES